MAFKLLLFACFLAFVHGSVVPRAFASVPAGAYGAVYGVPAAARVEDCHPLPQYKFGYDVADTLTGDYKSQIEQRDGDLVQGQYSLVESDGTLRVVEYTADSINGFNAVVRNEPLAASPIPAVVPARVAAVPPIATQPAVSSAAVFARYAAASRVVAPPVVASRTAVVNSAPVFSRYITPVKTATYTAPVYGTYSAAVSAPFSAPEAAPYTTSIATPYTAPYLDTAYAASYATPYAAAYSAPAAPAYSNLVTSSLSAPVVRYFSDASPPAAITAVRATPVGCS